MTQFSYFSCRFETIFLNMFLNCGRQLYGLYCFWCCFFKRRSYPQYLVPPECAGKGARLSSVADHRTHRRQATPLYRARTYKTHRCLFNIFEPGRTDGRLERSVDPRARNALDVRRVSVDSGQRRPHQEGQKTYCLLLLHVNSSKRNPNS